MTRRLSALALALAACAPAPDEQPAPLACNGSAHLCDRRYDEVSYACAHNAMSSEDDGWELPNQHHPMGRQLDDGVRALMLDIHDFEGVPNLCHGLCGLGRRPLADALRELKGWLDAHPHEVVSIQFEDYVSAQVTAQAFAEAGLLNRVHTQRKGEPWPTLREMIAADRRLVVFSERMGGEPAWYHDLWAYSFETDYEAKTPADLDCDTRRGTLGAPLLTLNHFLTNPFASPDLAAQVNPEAFLLERARRCESELHHRPTFVAVDFYDVGDVLSVVRQLNAP